MSPSGSQTQWYLARDGQQFGPISEAELAKFIELGHLQPTDLLWRDGFPDWRPAMVVFPPQSQGARPGGAFSGAGPQPARREPSTRGRSAASSQALKEERRAGRGGRARVMIVLVLVAGVLGGIWLAYANRGRLADYVSILASSSPSATALEIADRKSLEAPPLADLRGSSEAIDAKMQTTALWRVIKREFPDWYMQRVNEAASLSRDNKDDAAIAEHVARKLAELRRQQVANGLSATLPRIKTVVVAYFENLVMLRRHSPQACYDFISKGEESPTILAMLRGSDQTAHLQAHLTAMFEAIAEGRRQPRVYPRPSQAQHDMLAVNLRKMGWTQADMELFSDERALSHAPPEKVCQVVHDWYAAQLSLTDPEAQARLITDSARPIFGH
jgi:hypothetical protein